MQKQIMYNMEVIEGLFDHQMFPTLIDFDIIITIFIDY